MSAKTNEKLIQEIGSMSVLELADLIKQLESTFGVSAAMPTAVAAASAAPSAEAAKAEEKSEYKVTLTEAGPEKIKTIKVLREVVQGLALQDAKAKVDGVPSVIAEAVSKDAAKDMKTKLEAVGAKVELA